MEIYAIETYGLTKIYRNSVVAVDEVNLKVPNGVIFGLFGHNGAGKTTLISMLVGLILPTKGSGKVLGYDIIRESIEIRRKVGLLPEGFGFYDDLTARENLLYLAELDGIPREKAIERVEEVLELVGLKDAENKKVKEYSRGMKQRLGLAQALLKDPELLLLDEPTAGLDPAGAEDFRKLMYKLAKEGKTVFISTHLLQEVGMICTHAAILYKGRILVQGSFEEIAGIVKREAGKIFIITLGSPTYVKRALNMMAENKDRLGILNLKEEFDKLVITVEKSEDIDVVVDFINKSGSRVKTYEEYPSSWLDIFSYYHDKVGKG